MVVVTFVTHLFLWIDFCVSLCAMYLSAEGRLWRVDGATGDADRVQGIDPIDLDSSVFAFQQVGESLYFVDGYQQVWTIDGLATRAVTAVSDGPWIYPDLNSLLEWNGDLVFQRHHAGVTELISYTPATETRLAVWSIPTNYAVIDTVHFGDRLAFTTQMDLASGGNSVRVWITDGSTLGTRSVFKTELDGSVSWSRVQLLPYRDRLYLAAERDSQFEVWFANDSDQLTKLASFENVQSQVLYLGTETGDGFPLVMRQSSTGREFWQIRDSGAVMVHQSPTPAFPVPVGDYVLLHSEEDESIVSIHHSGEVATLFTGATSRIVYSGDFAYFVSANGLMRTDGQSVIAVDEDFNHPIRSSTAAVVDGHLVYSRINSGGLHSVWVYDLLEKTEQQVVEFSSDIGQVRFSGAVYDTSGGVKFMFSTSRVGGNFTSLVAAWIVGKTPAETRILDVRLGIIEGENGFSRHLGGGSWHQTHTLYEVDSDSNLLPVYQYHGSALAIYRGDVYSNVFQSFAGGTGLYRTCVADETACYQTGATNTENALDVNGDYAVSPLDALIVINELNNRDISMSGSGQLLAPKRLGPVFHDVNGDGLVAPLDALMVIAELNASTSARSELTIQTIDAAVADVSHDSRSANVRIDEFLADTLDDSKRTHYLKDVESTFATFAL